MVKMHDIEKSYNKLLVVGSWLASLNKEGVPCDSEVCGVLHIVMEVGEILDQLMDAGQVQGESLAE